MKAILTTRVTNISMCFLGNCMPFQDEKVEKQLLVVVVVI